MLDIVKKLLYNALHSLRPDMKEYILKCMRETSYPLESKILEMYLENEKLSTLKKIPMCQDTGLVSIYLPYEKVKELDYSIDLLRREVVEYMKTLNMRNSQVLSPIWHVNLGEEQVPFIKILPEWKNRVGVQISGAGSELQNFVMTFYSSQKIDDIIDTVVDEIVLRFPKACPPVTIGIGMGGTILEAAQLSKLALFRHIGVFHEENIVRELEVEFLKRIKKSSNRGAQGIIGGSCGVAHVAIEHKPSHIAGFHIAVSFQCYLTRSWFSYVY